jgi:RNA polymerase sigma-70 factor (ECF subfamily)
LCGKEVLFPCRTEERLAGSFLKACLSGDMEALLSLLSEDVTLYSDGGSKARAALKPIHGADRVAGLLPSVLRKDSPESIHFARINGQPGIFAYLADGRAAGVMVIEASEWRIRAIRFGLNPEKLRAVPPLGQVERKEIPE